MLIFCYCLFHFVAIEVRANNSETYFLATEKTSINQFFNYQESILEWFTNVFFPPHLHLPYICQLHPFICCQGKLEERDERSDEEQDSSGVSVILLESVCVLMV